MSRNLRQAGLHERQSCEYSAVEVTQGPTLAYSTHARPVDGSGVTFARVGIILCMDICMKKEVSLYIWDV